MESLSSSELDTNKEIVTKFQHFPASDDGYLGHQFVCMKCGFRKAVKLRDNEEKEFFCPQDGEKLTGAYITYLNWSKGFKHEGDTKFLV